MLVKMGLILAVRLVMTVECQLQQIQLPRTGRGCPAETWLVAPRGCPFPSTRLAPGHIPKSFSASAVDHDPSSLMFCPLKQSIRGGGPESRGVSLTPPAASACFGVSLFVTYLVCLTWAKKLAFSASSASSLFIFASSLVVPDPWASMMLNFQFSLCTVLLVVSALLVELSLSNCLERPQHHVRS